MHPVFIYISFLALLVSVISFYWSSIRVSNRLEAVFVYGDQVAGGVPVRDYGGALKITAIIINNGNRREALLRLALGFAAADGTLAGIGPGPQPFTIAPGDIQIYDLDHDMAAIKAGLARPGERWREFGVQVDLIAKGFVAHRFVRLGTIRHAFKGEAGADHVELVLEKAGIHVNLHHL